MNKAFICHALDARDYRSIKTAMHNEVENPLVPVYLNQRVVFDLIAMIQDGIATVTRVSDRTQSESSLTNQIDGSFGLNRAFSSLLSIRLSGKRGDEKTDRSSTSRDEERVHTPASLFYKLREVLNKKSFLKKDQPTYEPKSGDLIQFTSVLQRNPVIEAMDIISSIMDMADAFTDSTTQVDKQRRKNPNSNNQQIRQQIKKITDDLKSGGTIDLTSGKLECGYQAVVTADVTSLNDPTMSDLVDGTFCVVGKVIRTVQMDQGAVNLMRKATMGRLATKQLQQIFAELERLKIDHDFDLPKIDWEVKGPALQILPICIFA